MVGFTLRADNDNVEQSRAQIDAAVNNFACRRRDDLKGSLERGNYRRKVDFV